MFTPLGRKSGGGHAEQIDGVICPNPGRVLCPIRPCEGSDPEDHQNLASPSPQMTKVLATPLWKTLALRGVFFGAASA